MSNSIGAKQNLFKPLRKSNGKNLKNDLDILLWATVQVNRGLARPNTASAYGNYLLEAINSGRMTTAEAKKALAEKVIRDTKTGEQI